MDGKKISFGKRIILEIFHRYQLKKIKEHPLRNLFWECTLRCNASCRHCGSDCKVSTKVGDMPAADFLKVIDSIKPHIDVHKTFIIFTGGECLVRKDLEKVGLELCKREFPWGIVTNGLLLDKKRFDSLIASGMHSITISLDGFEDAHNWLRQVPGGFEKAVRAIRYAVAEKNLVYDVVTCANKRNFDSLAEFRDFLISLGVKAWRIFTIFPVGRAANDPELQLSDLQFTKLLDFIKQTRIDGKIKLSYGCEGFLGKYEMEVRDNVYSCDAGITTASILADGNISACPSIRADYHQGNIYEDDLMEVWNNKFIPYRERSWMKNGICGNCKVFKYCMGNGMHLRDSEGKLLLCHYNRIVPIPKKI